MNKINLLFEKKQNNILSIYYTAGFPNLNDTGDILNELINNGVDMIEVGIPFSDPLADGPTIQHSGEVALNNGMNLKLLFQQLSNCKLNEINQPIILMGYLNPILQFGFEQFCIAASEIGVSGVIIPDLPMEEYLEKYKLIFNKCNIKNIFLITPQTSKERIKIIDDNSNSFIYMVSSAATTGNTAEINQSQENYFKSIKSMQLKNPTLIGFGISNAISFKKACEYSQGAIVGSAFIKQISSNNDFKTSIKQFVHTLKNYKL